MYERERERERQAGRGKGKALVIKFFLIFFASFSHSLFFRGHIQGFHVCVCVRERESVRVSENEFKEEES